ncbi:hypothetical protein F2P81_014558 [Scophthalmus maximus]|uniref:Cytochrome c oxidase assembly factor 3 n=1 Tax=Scophthalmus maximus TaxID=52904 RepID=A0A6A4SJB6_SCOMX|nr:hypothetical protein F2P81_014558 [Scophthalmus maximus]
MKAFDACSLAFKNGIDTVLRVPELDYHWKKNAPRLRRRNLLTGLAIGAFVVGMFSYTIVSVKQERIVEELDDEARIHISRGPRTSANS